MSNPTGPDRPDETTDGATEPESPDAGDPAEAPAQSENEPATEIIEPGDQDSTDSPDEPGERRYTAPSGFDAGSTQIIDRPAEPPTEAFTAA
ncbi:MAG: DUF4878 domain-containing protein, partial [Actinomycetota bacterium]|nr:DUF4878 domain-containing protein [Actinomycetota bacterium]